MPDSCSRQITTFLEQWRKLRVVVNEMGTCAKMISRNEEVLEDNTELKAKLKRPEEEIGSLNRVIEEMIVKFERRHVALQEKHDSSLHEMNILVQDIKRKIGIRHGELEKSVQNCLALEKDLQSQNASLS